MSKLPGVPLSIYCLMPAPPALSVTNPQTPVFATKYIHTDRSSDLCYPSLSSSLCLSSDTHYPTISISSSASYSGIPIAASETWLSHFSHPSPLTMHTSNKQQSLGARYVGGVAGRGLITMTGERNRGPDIFTGGLPFIRSEAKKTPMIQDG